MAMISQRLLFFKILLGTFTLLYRIFTKQPNIMLREILTLTINNIPVQYFIRFGRERQRFTFQPTLKNKEAPVFVIVIKDNELKIAGDIDERLAEQAREKVREIISNSIFDRF